MKHDVIVNKTAISMMCIIGRVDLLLFNYTISTNNCDDLS